MDKFLFINLKEIEENSEKRQQDNLMVEQESNKKYLITLNTFQKEDTISNMEIKEEAKIENTNKDKLIKEYAKYSKNVTSIDYSSFKNRSKTVEQKSNNLEEIKETSEINFRLSQSIKISSKTSKIVTNSSKVGTNSSKEIKNSKTLSNTSEIKTTSLVHKANESDESQVELTIHKTRSNIMKLSLEKDKESSIIKGWEYDNKDSLDDMDNNEGDGN